MTRYYAGIGARAAPKDILLIAEQLSKEIDELSIGLRSGHAVGMDTAFEKPVLAHRAMEDYSGRLVPPEIYLPWTGFNGARPSKYYIDATKLPKHDEANELIKTIHPAYHRLTGGVKLLHSRNAFQVLGRDLESPSLFVLFWAEPIAFDKKGRLIDEETKIVLDKDDISPRAFVKGGTNTAVSIAHQNGIPLFNLYFDEDIERFKEFLETLKAEK